MSRVAVLDISKKDSTPVVSGDYATLPNFNSNDLPEIVIDKKNTKRKKYKRVQHKPNAEQMEQIRNMMNSNNQS